MASRLTLKTLDLAARHRPPATMSVAQCADRSARSAVLCALATAVVSVALTWGSPQAVFNDPVLQLKAVQQYMAGQSPNFNTMVSASPGDLGRNLQQWIVIWPPGMGLLLLPLLSHGLRLATAVRLLAVACYLVGCIGWAVWVTQFRMRRMLLVVLAGALPFSHYATTPLLQYYTESFNWAFVPWVLLGALVVARDGQGVPGARLLWRAALLGLALGLLYWFKYSAVFVSAGVLIFFTLGIVRRRDGRGVSRLLAMALVCAGVIGALTVWNKTMGTAANYAAATVGWFPSWRSLVNVLGLFPLAMADAEGLLHWIFLRPGHPILHDPFVLALVGFPFGCALVWILFRRTDAEAPVWLARSVAGASVLALLAVWTLSEGGAGREARHLAGAAIACVPVAVQEVGFLLRRRQRVAFALAGCVLLAIPLLYGAASVAGKAFRVRAFRPGPAGFYDPAYGRDGANISRHLRAYASPDGVWYVCTGGVALDMPGRILLRWADLLPAQSLRQETYHSSVPLRVNLLLPPSFEQNGKGAVIRASFPQAQRWMATKVPGFELTLWSTTLR